MKPLFEPLPLRSVITPNRIGMSPMCMYSYKDGIVTNFQAVHLGSRAIGGVGLIIAEATAVQAIGRITPYDAGIWNDGQISAHAHTVEAIKAGGAVAGIQLAHAGRKASTDKPWTGGKPILPNQEGGWQPIAPSAIAFADDFVTPTQMTQLDLDQLRQSFVDAARRALSAGYQFIEIHAAHGYLLHSFLSPLANNRTDSYGGIFENRIRLLIEIVDGIRAVWPDVLPLGVRLSATDWHEGGWTISDSVELAKVLKIHGVDLVDCSSGGILPTIKIPVAPGYQVPFAEQVRREATMMTAAVGLITDPEQANLIIETGQADMVLLGRRLLSEPYWPQTAAKILGAANIIPNQYLRGH